jgi:hypothetical protein
MDRRTTRDSITTDGRYAMRSVGFGIQHYNAMKKEEAP